MVEGGNNIVRMDKIVNKCIYLSYKGYKMNLIRSRVPYDVGG